MEIEEETVLKVLALAIPNEKADHYIAYLLKKLYGKDGLSLDRENTELYSRIVLVADEIKAT